MKDLAIQNIFACFHVVYSNDCLIPKIIVNTQINKYIYIYIYICINTQIISNVNKKRRHI